MKCPKCRSTDIEKRIVNQEPVLERYICSGMHSRLNKVIVHTEYFCKNCNHKWKK